MDILIAILMDSITLWPCWKCTDVYRSARSTLQDCRSELSSQYAINCLTFIAVKHPNQFGPTLRWCTQWQNDNLGSHYYQIQFMALQEHEQNSTYDLSKRFGMESDQSCRLCNGEKESLEEILMVCPASGRVRSFDGDRYISVILRGNRAG